MNKHDKKVAKTFTKQMNAGKPCIVTDTTHPFMGEDGTCDRCGLSGMDTNEEALYSLRARLVGREGKEMHFVPWLLVECPECGAIEDSEKLLTAEHAHAA